VARQVLAAQPQLVARLAGLLERPPRTLRIRCHGDYHLGQVLTTGDDFVIIDFEGEPTRSLAQRRAKQPPLRDVAGMLRSLDYARHVAQDLLADAPGGHSARRLAWWQEAASASFLAGYRAHLPPGELVPADPAEFQRLLDVFLLEKAVYEVAYELNHRPAWASIPLTALARLSGSG
jgi:trehalose synthase-fused probable maltokinase